VTIKTAREGKLAADQRHINANTSIIDIAAEVENDQLKNVRKLAQAHGVITKMVHPFFTRI
jgi:predicted kinase